MPDASAQDTRARMHAIAAELQAAGLTAQVHEARGVLDITASAPSARRARDRSHS
jgi:hypothetical protein